MPTASNTVNPGLTSAMQSALSGLDAASRRLALSADNLSNVNNPDHTVKTIDVHSVLLNGVGCGIQTGEVRRIVNDVLLEQVRLQITDTAYADQLNVLYRSIQERFGSPMGETGLPQRIRTFANSLSALSNSPETNIHLSNVISTTQNLTPELKSLGEYIQYLRSNCDFHISDAVKQVNQALDHIKQLNQKIVENYNVGLPTVGYQDQMDSALRTIAQYVNVQVNQQTFNHSSGQSLPGLIDITLKNGISLVQGVTVHPIDFEPTTNFSPALLQPTPMTVNGQDINQTLSQGMIGACIQMRDNILPGLQNDLDTLTITLRDEVNKVHNLGSGYPPAQQLVGQRTFPNGLATPFTGQGTLRIALVDQGTGACLETIEYDLANAATVQDLCTHLTGTQIQVGLNADNTLVVASTQANAGIAITSVGNAPATETLTGQSLGFSHYFGLNDFFITPSFVIGDGQPIHGITNEFRLHPVIAQNRQLISRGQLNTQAVGAPLVPGVLPQQLALYSGDQSIIQRLSDSLNKEISFPASTNLSPRSESFSSYAGDIISYNAVSAKNNQNVYDSKKKQLDLVKASFQNLSGVNDQEEILNILREQRFYALSSKVAQIINKLYDSLISIMG